MNASKRVNNTSITVIDGLSASVGLGLIVMKAAELVQQGIKHKEIQEALPEIISSTEIFLVMKDLSYVVRGGRLPKGVKIIADFIHIRPILTTKKNGSMGIAGIVLGTTNLPEKIHKFVKKKK